VALEKVFHVAREVDSKTMSLQYLEALKTIGASQSTKLLVWLKLTTLMQSFASHATASDGRHAAAGRSLLTAPPNGADDDRHRERQRADGRGDRERTGGSGESVPRLVRGDPVGGEILAIRRRRTIEWHASDRRGY
jgi:hypothetical protein